MGKHSDFVFSENTNSQVDIENGLLNGSECLTGQILNSNIFEIDDPSEMASVELNIVPSTTTIGQQCFDLLKEFEVNKTWLYLLLQ